MSQLKVDENLNYSIVSLSGQFIGSDETYALRDRLKQIKSKNLILDLDNVTYINSTALGVLISAQADFLKKNGKVIITNISDNVKKIINITNINKIFEVTESINQAIKQLS